MICGTARNMPKIKRKKKKHRELLKNIATFLIAMLICLILLELVSRIVIRDHNYTEFDPELGSRHIPYDSAWHCTNEFCHKHTINNAGFLDDDFSEEKGDEFRIFIFGDSFIAAEQVASEDAMHMLLESTLQEKNENIVVYNFGHSGFSTDQYYLSLKKYGERYKPDLVLFAIFTANDLHGMNMKFSGNICKPFFELEGNTVKQVERTCRASSFFESIKKVLKHSRFVEFVFEKGLLIRNKFLVSQGEEGVPTAYLVYDPDNEEYQNSFKVHDALLLAAEQYSESLGASFAVVTLPSKEQVNPAIWDQLKEKYPPLAEEGVDPTYPTKRIDQFCKAADISCLHLLEPFKSEFEKNGNDLYFWHDGHWNEEGNRLATELIDNFLNEQLLIPDHGKE